MATVLAELHNLWTNMVAAEYPDIPTIDAAIDLTTMKAVNSQDLIAFFLATSLVNLRSASTYGYNLPESSTDKKLLYQEYLSMVTAAVNNLIIIEDALTAYIVTLS